MKLELITGRAAEGKTFTLYEKLGRLVSSGRENVVLVVPDQFTDATERRLLRHLGAPVMNRVRVSGFARLAERTLREYDPSLLPAASEAAKAMIMHLTIEGLRDSIDIFDPDTRDFSLEKGMLSADAVFSADSLSADALRDCASRMEQGPLAAKARETAMILEGYRESLNDLFSDKNSYPDALRELLRRDPAVFAGYTFAFDAFNGFTGAEYALIDALMVRARECCFCLCTDKTSDAEDDTGAFTYVRGTASKLIQSAKKHGIPVSVVHPDAVDSGRNDALDHLERNIYVPVPEVFDGDASAIRTVRARDVRDECEFVAREIKRLLMDEGLRCRDIAVIQRSDGTYNRRLFSAFKKYGIPYFDDRRRCITEEPLIRALLAAIDCAVTELNTENILVYAKSGFSALDDAEVCAIDSYTAMWDIKGSKWRERWTMSPRGLGSGAADDEFADAINSAREKLVTPLLDFKKELCAASTGREFCEAVMDFLSVTGAADRVRAFASELYGAGRISEAKNSALAWDALTSLLTTIAAVTGERGLKPVIFRNILTLSCAVTSTGDIPRGLDAVTVGSAERIRLGDVNTVFVVGAVQDEFPKYDAALPVFTQGEYDVLQDNGFAVDVDPDTRAAKERLLVYRALSAPKERLYVVYREAGYDGNEVFPSEAVTMISRIFPSNKETGSAEKDFLALSRGKKPAFTQYVRSADRDAEFHVALRELLSEDPQYAGRIAGADRMIENKRAAIADRDVAVRLFGETLNLSTTQIEKYHKCPFAYFCRYGMRVTGPASSDLDAALTGTLIHYVLQVLMLSPGPRGIASLDEEKRYALCRKTVNDYVSEHFDGVDPTTGAMRYRLSNITVILEKCLERIIGEFAGSDFVVSDTELAIGKDIPPYKLGLPDGGEIVIRGSVDRVDTCPIGGRTYVRVVDYKTGKQDFSFADVLAGLDLQMLVYLICAVENGKDRYGDTVPAGVLYFNANAVPDPDLGRDPDEEQRKKSQKKKYVMKGFVLDDEELIRAMEHDGEGVYIPARVTGGEVKGKTIDLMRLKKLHGYIDGLLTDMGQALHDGGIEDLPVDKPVGRGQTVCEFCDYRDVCMRMEQDSGFRIREYQTEKEALEKLGEGDEDGE